MQNFSPLIPVSLNRTLKLPFARLLDVALVEARRSIPPMPLSGGVRKAWKRSVDQELARIKMEFGETADEEEYEGPTGPSLACICGYTTIFPGLKVDFANWDPECEQCGKSFSGKSRPPRWERILD